MVPVICLLLYPSACFVCCPLAFRSHTIWYYLRLHQRYQTVSARHLRDSFYTAPPDVLGSVLETVSVCPSACIFSPAIRGVSASLFLAGINVSGLSNHSFSRLKCIAIGWEFGLIVSFIRRVLRPRTLMTPRGPTQYFRNFDEHFGAWTDICNKTRSQGCMDDPNTFLS